jgi:hypothetical protein
MTEAAIEQPITGKAPWHLWVVGILSLLWNAGGTWTYVQAQSGAPMDMDAAEIAYFAAQAPWFVAVTDVAVMAPLIGALALLLRSRWAVHLYALSIAAIVVTSVWDISQGTALMLNDRGWLILNCVTFCLAIAQLAYAMAMKGRGVLR